MPLIVRKMACRICCASGPLGSGRARQAAQQADLDEVERIDIRVAPAHGALQGRLVFQQFALAGDAQNPVAGLAEGAFDLVVDRVAHRFVGDQTGVETGDAHVGLGQGHLGVVDDDPEERPFLVHRLQQRQPVWAVSGQRLRPRRTSRAGHGGSASS